MYRELFSLSKIYLSSPVQYKYSVQFYRHFICINNLFLIYKFKIVYLLEKSEKISRNIGLNVSNKTSNTVNTQYLAALLMFPAFFVLFFSFNFKSEMIT